MPALVRASVQDETRLTVAPTAPVVLARLYGFAPMSVLQQPGYKLVTLYS